MSVGAGVGEGVGAIVGVGIKVGAAVGVGSLVPVGIGSAVAVAGSSGVLTSPPVHADRLMTVRNSSRDETMVAQRGDVN